MAELSNINSIIGSIFKKRVESIINQRKRYRRETKARQASSRLMAKGMLTYPLPERADSYIQELIDYLSPIWSLFEQSQWQVGLYGEIDRALVHVSYVRQNYSAVQCLIGQMHKTGSIPKWMESELEDIWHYSIFASYIVKAKHTNGSKQLTTVAGLTAVQKYRLRKRWPCPTEVNQDKRYKIGRKEREILFATYLESPRPSRSIKESLVKQTGLLYSVITNWFKNSRQRSKSDCTKKPASTMLVPNPTAIISYSGEIDYQSTGDYQASGGSYSLIDYNQASGCQFGCCQPSQLSNSYSSSISGSSSISISSSSGGGSGSGSYQTSNHQQLQVENNYCSTDDNSTHLLPATNDYYPPRQYDVDDIIDLMFSDHHDPQFAC